MGRDRKGTIDTLPEGISIHSPRMGRDGRAALNLGRADDFNPLSPHGERRTSTILLAGAHGYFNPLSPHGERRYGCATCAHGWNFNPLSPHGERHGHNGKIRALKHFNPLSPHGERPGTERPSRRCGRFQSTLPAWGETKAQVKAVADRNISIHSPRMGRDKKPTRALKT